MGNYHEGQLGHLFLYSTLSGDSTLTGFAPGGVSRAVASPQASTPFVIVAYQAGTDSVTMNGYRMIVDSTYQVRAVGPSTQSLTVAQAAAQIDKLLGSPPGTPVSGDVIVSSVTEGRVLSCYRLSPLVLDEMVEDALWVTMGGLYRLVIEQQAS